MTISNEKVKLDEILKLLFSSSKTVLIKLLNAVFDEEFTSDDVELTVSNNEFIADDLGVSRGDIFFYIRKSDDSKYSYHIELQTKSDNGMVIRMFEYGYKKAKEEAKRSKSSKKSIPTIYFPKQKVIFFEKNKSISDTLQLKVVFPYNKYIIYTVDVLKYWEYTDTDLITKKMYPLLPLQLFTLRKALEKARNKKDYAALRKYASETDNLARKIAMECSKLFEQDEILGEDFHKMLLAIQNLIEYLNRKYIKDDRLEEEVIKLTKTLYDPEVEKRGLEKGEKKNKVETIRKLLSKGCSISEVKRLLDYTTEDIADILDVSIDAVNKL